MEHCFATMNKELDAQAGLNNLEKRLLTRDYFKEFKFDILSASTACLLHIDFVFTWKLQYVSFSIFKFKLNLHNV